MTLPKIYYGKLHQNYPFYILNASFLRRLEIKGKSMRAGKYLSHLHAMANPALSLTPFGRWTLRDETARAGHLYVSR